MTKDEMVGWHHQLRECELRSPGRWGRARKPSVLQSMGSHRIRHD